MKIKRCYIENFGCLKKKSFDFSDGLTCIVSDNGTGKSTLGAFITAMLYGIGDTRKLSLSENDRKKYAPWDGGVCAGSLTIEIGKKEYRIERSFAQKAADDTFRLIETHTGLISADFSENIGEELLGIDRDGFLRTAYLSEKALSVKNDNKTISAKLSDLVGADGDVGEFDRAIDSIEEQRRLLYKKGGSGLISDLKAKLSVQKKELERLENLDEELSGCKERFNDIAKEYASTESKRSLVEKQLEKIGEITARQAQEEKYRSLVEEYEREKLAFDRLCSFFICGVPSLSAIDRARDDSLECARLSRELARISQSEKSDERPYENLSYSEIYEAEARVEALRECERRIGEFDRGEDGYSLRMRRIFESTPPTLEELERLAKIAPKKSIPLTIIAGLILIIAGALLGAFVSPYAYVVCALGAIIAFLHLPASRKEKSDGGSATKLAQEHGIYAKNADEALAKLKDAKCEYDDIKRQREDEKASLLTRQKELKSAHDSFVSHFGLGFLEPKAAIAGVREGYAVWQHDKLIDESNAEVIAKKAELIKNLTESVEAFLKKYKTTTEDPFDEIRRAVNEYNYKDSLLGRLAQEIEDYRTRYGLSERYKEEINTVKDSSTLKEELTGLNLTLSELVSERALLEKRIAEISFELDRVDEVKAEISSLEDSIEEKEERLSLLKKTREHLEKACNNMTGRYLGRTRERFLEYEKRISGQEGEFSLDTSFTPSKSEGGVLRSEDSFSRGTRDLYALAIRLALIDSLYENEQPFIILDDPFIAFDDEKCKRGLGIIKQLARDRQVIYLTCSKSRAT